MKFFIAISLIFILLTLPAQSNGKSFVFRCTLKDSKTNKAAAFAHVYNESRRYGLISDSSGYFATNVELGDTLAIIAMGYLATRYVISSADSNGSIIYIEPRYYEINEVDVSIPRNYGDFKQAVLNLDLDKGKPPLTKGLPQHNPFVTPQLLDTNVIDNLGFKITHPLSAIYLKHNKREKSKRKVWQLQQQELKQASVDAKYNRNLVSDITGFSEFDLINFMGWCNFSFNYLYTASGLEIVEAIHKKYNEYIQCCYEKQIDTLPE